MASVFEPFLLSLVAGMATGIGGIIAIAPEKSHSQSREFLPWIRFWRNAFGFIQQPLFRGSETAFAHRANSHVLSRRPHDDRLGSDYPSH